MASIRRTTRQALRSTRKIGRASRKEMRKTMVASELPSTRLARAGVHASHVTLLAGAAVATLEAAVAIKRAWRELRKTAQGVTPPAADAEQVVTN